MKRNLLTTFTARRYGSDADEIPTDPAELKLVGGVPWYVFVMAVSVVVTICASLVTPNDVLDKRVEMAMEL